MSTKTDLGNVFSVGWVVNVLEVRFELEALFYLAVLSYFIAALVFRFATVFVEFLVPEVTIVGS